MDHALDVLTLGDRHNWQFNSPKRSAHNSSIQGLRLNHAHSSIARIFNPFPLRAVVDRVDLFDEDVPLAVDWEFWLRAARAYRFDYVDEPLVLCRAGRTLGRPADWIAQTALKAVPSSPQGRTMEPCQPRA
jgi:hypothetical protein